MRKAINFRDDFYAFLAENNPQTFTKAMTFQDALLWKEAISSELDSIISKHVWEIIDLSQSTKSISRLIRNLKKNVLLPILKRMFFVVLIK